MYERTIWDFWATRYENLWAQYFSLGPARVLIHQHLEVTMPHAERILDIGCGIGQLAFELSQKRPHAQIFAADTSLKMIERARIDYPATNITHLQASIEDIPANDPFDLIIFG